jgi:hypothetical protein
MYVCMDVCMYVYTYIHIYIHTYIYHLGQVFLHFFVAALTRLRHAIQGRESVPAYVSMRQHTSAYVSMRQHTSAYVSIRQHKVPPVCCTGSDNACVSLGIRQHPSAPVSIYLREPGHELLVVWLEVGADC